MKKRSLARRVTVLGVSLLLCASGVALSAASAQAAEGYYATAVHKSEGVTVQSANGNYKGGKVKVDVGLDGWVAASSYGQLMKRVNNSSPVTVLSYGAGVNSWGWASGSLVVGALNRGWWYYNGSWPYAQPLSAKNIW